MITLPIPAAGQPFPNSPEAQAQAAAAIPEEPGFLTRRCIVLLLKTTTEDVPCSLLGQRTSAVAPTIILKMYPVLCSGGGPRLSLPQVPSCWALGALTRGHCGTHLSRVNSGLHDQSPSGCRTFMWTMSLLGSGTAAATL